MLKSGHWRSRCSSDRSTIFGNRSLLAKVRQGDAAPMAVIALLGESEMIKAPTRPAVVGAGRKS